MRSRGRQVQVVGLTLSPVRADGLRPQLWAVARPAWQGGGGEGDEDPACARAEGRAEGQAEPCQLLPH